MTNRERSDRNTAVLAVFILAALALGFVAPRVNAQVLYGSLVGTVQDESGAVIPNAAVGIMNTGTGATLEAQSSADGVYRFTNVIAGMYDLTVTAEGFRVHTESGINVTVNRSVRLDVMMQIGQVTLEAPSEKGRGHA